jgi:predicted Zn finger-like uncharacterized protein
MRIICPNCGAQYEVDPRVIPDVGRDVQCSNCGHTWFQRPQSAVTASVRRVVEDPPVSPGPDDDRDDDDPAYDDPSDRDAPAPGGRAADVFPAIATDDGSDEPAPVATPAVAAPEAPAAAVDDPGPAAVPGWSAPADPVAPADDRSTLDDATRALLREEAEREARARAAERRPLVEVQGDFALAPPATSVTVTGHPPPRAVQRTADLAAVDPAAPSPVAAALAAAAARRDSLPDVDSISSSLRTGAGGTDDAGDTASAAPAEDRRFRSGFLLILLLVIAASAVYLLAPTLADAVPELRAPLAGYVDWVNGLRAAITGALSGLAAMLTGSGG